MLQKLILYIALLISFNSLAQPYVSVRGDFSVDQRRGCTGMFITVNNIRPGDGVILYQYETRSENPTNQTNHTYNSAGSFWLYQYIQGGMAGTRADSILIEIFDPEVVDFRLESCNNNNVLVTIENTNYDEYEINYGDGTIIRIPVFGFAPAHLYNAAGPYTVSVAGLYTTANNQCGSNSLSYTPVNNVLSATINQLEVLDNTNLIIDYTLAPFTSSTLEISLNGNGSFQTFKDLDQGTSRDTLSGLNMNNSYCLRIASNDACSNFKAYSNEVCSISLELTPVNDAMDLSWQTQFLANFSRLNILRNDTILASLSSAGTSYKDTTALCTNNYCYQVQVINSDGSQSISETVCGTAFSTTKPNSVTNVSTTIDEEVVSWSWQVPLNEVVDNFRIRDADGVVVSNTDQANLSLDITDPLTCIQFEFTNNCGNTSDRSRIFCPLLIDFQITADGGTLVSWAPYEGYSGGVNGYTLLIYDQSMTLMDSLWLNTNLSYEDPLPSDDNQISFYRVIAEPVDNGLAPSKSNLLTVERPPVISLPSSFTPNGDGLNDLFEITGKYIMSQELTIFNRWGSILFSSDSEGWDGTAAGDKVEAGTYIYQAKVKDFAGKEHIRTGSVLILKD